MLKIGWATREFTPVRPAMIHGQMHRRIGREALDPLTVTALAIEGETPREASILISHDGAGVPVDMLQELRDLLAAQLPEVDSARVVMNATHTHESLVTIDNVYEQPAGDVMTPAECRTLVATRAAEAAVAAWRARTPQLVGRAYGHAVVGHNRFAQFRDGHAAMYANTNDREFRHFVGYEDHSLDMLATWTPDGRLTGLLLAVPCPSQVTEHLEQFSADFWSEIRQELRARLSPDVVVFAACGVAGDQSPHHLLNGKLEKEMRERRGLTQRQEIGQRVADGVLRALEHTRPPPASPPVAFRHRWKRVMLPPRRATRAERDWAAAELDRWGREKGETTSWWPRSQRRVVEEFDGIRRPEPTPADLHALRMGDLVIATNPFELFLDYGVQIKARSPAVQTMTIQLAGPGLYVPTRRAVRGGGYSAIPAVAPIGPAGGQKVVDETLRLIDAVWTAE
jgi:hypothetical protein